MKANDSEKAPSNRGLFWYNRITKANKVQAPHTPKKDPQRGDLKGGIARTDYIVLGIDILLTIR